MTSRRWFAILIGFLVLAHGVVMATDTRAVHAADHDTDIKLALSLVCSEDEAIPQGARLPLEPSFPFVSTLAGTGAIPDSGMMTGTAPEAPYPSGQTLRALLQVFLN